MSITPEYIPSELRYIIPLAEQHGTNARVAHYDCVLDRHVEYAERLSDTEIEPLRQLYREISAKGHGPLLNRWYQNRSSEGSCPAETTWPVGGLLYLFDQLSRLGISPFNDGVVRLEEQKSSELDWSKLPSSLRYLAGPAEVYGELQFENRIIDFLRERMTPEEQDELRALRQRVKQDWQAIDRWLKEFPKKEHREAALVYFTGCLLATGADLGRL